MPEESFSLARFSDFGEVVEVVPIRKDESRGVAGYVKFKEHSAAERCIKEGLGSWSESERVLSSQGSRQQSAYPENMVAKFLGPRGTVISEVKNAIGAPMLSMRGKGVGDAPNSDGLHYVRKGERLHFVCKGSSEVHTRLKPALERLVSKVHRDVQSKLAEQPWRPPAHPPSPAVWTVEQPGSAWGLPVATAVPPTATKAQGGHEETPAALHRKRHVSNEESLNGFKHHKKHGASLHDGEDYLKDNSSKFSDAGLADDAQAPHCQRIDTSSAEFFSRLTPDLSTAEQDLREAVLAFLHDWETRPDNDGCFPNVVHLGADARIRKCQSAVIPRYIGLKTWITKRLAADIEIKGQNLTLITEELD
jgi:hypothetical protein